MGELAATLRSWRARADPAALGLSPRTPRRTPGLRREELATLAGISIEYVTRLEQGRLSTPSAQVCAALARALRLSDDEQAHLMRLAGHGIGPDLVPRRIPTSVRRIVQQWAADPVAVYDATWDLLDWNPMFAAAFGNPASLPIDHRNALLAHFQGRLHGVRYSPQDGAAFEASVVADLRATTSRYPRDPRLTTLLARLLHSDHFRDLWSRGSVAAHQGTVKTIEHPSVGHITVRSDTLITQDNDLRIVVCTAPAGSEARGKLDLLGALGPEALKDDAAS
jgi:transcriptional regulator with XRE-family HTH domain